MPLTDTALRSLKPTASVQKLSDGGGLQLWLHPNGSKLWRLAYRFDGKQKKLSIGAYPTVSLKDARAAREDAKRQLAFGKDPGLQKQVAKANRATSQANTFGIVADELIAKKAKEGQAQRSLEKHAYMIGIIRSSLGPRPIAEITAPEVLAILKAIEHRGNNETARRLRGLISEVFRFGIATARCETDPTFGLRGALPVVKTKHYAAITTPERAGGLMRAIAGFDGQPSTVAAMKLMAYCFPRPGELRAARWPDIDLEGAVWSFPAEVMKMRRPHRAPLSRQAVETLRWLKPITSRGRAGLVFPGVRSVDQSISENTMNATLRRLGYSGEEMTSHGFRSMASTLLNASGLWSSDAIERALAHVEANETRKAYNRDEKWDERVRMAQWWADYLDELRLGPAHNAGAR